MKHLNGQAKMKNTLYFLLLCASSMASANECRMTIHAKNDTGSTVAAGLFNPVVFRRMNLGWRTEECLPEAIAFYRWAEKITGSTFCYPTGLHRIHGSDDERKLWAERLLEEDWHHHIGQSEPSEEKPWLNQPFGGASVHSAGFVSTLDYLGATRNWLKSQNLLIEEPFLYDDLDISEPLLRWKNLR